VAEFLKLIILIVICLKKISKKCKGTAYSKIIKAIFYGKNYVFKQYALKLIDRYSLLKSKATRKFF